MVISNNDDEAEKNHELKLFLSTQEEPRNLRSTVIDNCIAVGANDNMSSIATADSYIEAIRSDLGRYLREGLQRAHSVLLERRGEESLIHLSLAAEERDIDNLTTISPSDPQEELMIAHQFIGPDIPSRWYNWLMIFFMTLVAGLMSGMYLLIYYSIIAELCYWLYEIHMKVRISQCILQYLDGYFAVSFNEGYDKSVVLDDESFCNIRTNLVLKHSVSSRTDQMKICRLYARELCRMDSLILKNQKYNVTEVKNTRLGSARKDSHGSVGRHRLKAAVFMSSTYLDFRLFSDQIEDYRKTLDFIIGYCIIHGLNIVYFSRYIDDTGLKISFVFFGMLLPNSVLFAAGLFQSQCNKALKPIHDLIAFAISGDKFTRHLCYLWRRALFDATGPNTKFCLRAYSFNITLTTVLQFNLTVASLYILTINR